MTVSFFNKTFVRVGALLTGAFTVLCSLPFIALGLSEMFSGELPVGLVIVVFFALTTLVGGLLSWWGMKRPAVDAMEDEAEMERRLLQFARSHGGNVTVSQLAAESPLSAAEARHALERLEMLGICSSAPSSTGGLFYRFPDFLPDGTRTESEVEFDFSDEQSATVDAAAVAHQKSD